MKLPRRINLLRRIDVVVEPTMTDYGDFEPRLAEWRIRVNPMRPEVDQHHTFIHEVLHAVDEACKQAGLYARYQSHTFVDVAAAAVLAALVQAGVYVGVSRREANAALRRAWKQAKETK